MRSLRYIEPHPKAIPGYLLTAGPPPLPASLPPFLLAAGGIVVLPDEAPGRAFALNRHCG
jgi:hypothetical protein